MSTHVVVQFINMLATLQQSSTLRNSGLPKMFDTVRFFRGYRRCFICRISRIPKGCLLQEYGYSIFFELLRLSQLTEDNNFIFVELVGFPSTAFLNDVRFDITFPKVFFYTCFDSAQVGLPEIGCSTQCWIFPEVITDNRRYPFR